MKLNFCKNFFSNVQYYFIFVSFGVTILIIISLLGGSFYEKKIPENEPSKVSTITNLNTSCVPITSWTDIEKTQKLDTTVIIL